MRIIGFGLCGPGEADRYLEGTLDEFERLCDDTIILGNNIGPKERAAIKRRGFWLYEDNREWGKDQPRLKTTLLEKAARLRPDYIIPLDMDEVFDRDIDRPTLESIASDGALGYNFYIVNHWNDPEHYWRASGFWNVRFYKYAPEFGVTFMNKNVHCGLAPPYAYHHARNTPHFVHHYGLMEKETRMRKVERYKQYDPGKTKVGIGAYYDAIAADGTGTLFNHEEMRAKLIHEVSKEKRPMKIKIPSIEAERKIVWVRRIKDDARQDMPLKNALDCIARKTHTMDSSTPEAVKPLPPVIEPDANECPLCGFVAKNERGLATHKKTH